MSRAEAVAKALDPEKAKKAGRDWVARCPAHNDNNPSLFFKDAPGRENPVFICRAGCEGKDVIRELKERDLWINSFDSGEVHAWQLEQEKAEADYKRLLDGIKAGNGEAATLAYLKDEPTHYLPATVPEFMKFQSELPPEEILTGGIPMGSCGMLAAQPGVGKSMLAMGIAVAVSRGTDFCGWETPRARRVLIVDVELETRELGKRLATYGAVDNIWLDWEDWRRRANAPSFELGNQEHQSILMEIIKEIEADFVIIDNVTFCLVPTDKGMFDPSTWKQVQPMMSWFRAQQKALLFVDHTNKSGAVAGSLNKERSADYIIRLSSDGYAPAGCLEFDLEFTKYRYERTGGNTVNRLMTFQDGVWRSVPIKNKYEMFIDLMDQGLGEDRIKGELGISRSTYYSLKKRYDANPMR